MSDELDRYAVLDPWAFAEIASLRAQLDEARRKAIEECAAIAETHIHGWEQDEYTAPAAHAVRKLASSEIAQAIRALLSESKT